MNATTILLICLCLYFCFTVSSSIIRMTKSSTRVSQKPDQFVPGIMTGQNSPALKVNGQPYKNSQPLKQNAVNKQCVSKKVEKKVVKNSRPYSCRAESH